MAGFVTVVRTQEKLRGQIVPSVKVSVGRYALGMHLVNGRSASQAVAMCRRALSRVPAPVRGF
jgi:hypothetical protein